MLTTAILDHSLYVYRTLYSVRSAIKATAEIAVILLDCIVIALIMNGAGNDYLF